MPHLRLGNGSFKQYHILFGNGHIARFIHHIFKIQSQILGILDHYFKPDENENTRFYPSEEGQKEFQEQILSERGPVIVYIRSIFARSDCSGPGA